MATMVLTAVGSAVGGPIGGAIGALAGGFLDREVIARPGRREGARLADLRIQASSYGVAIPQVFGTMRVAGSVIWATDLIERRSDGRAGKGSPTVSSYSYAASFAVLLSGRPIVGVGRVWADGKLLRGAGGDLKVAGAMRVHLGGENQAPDPLIASAEGAAAPAHRGLAYAVFETLALADFGNRIPSLTFEVVADAGPVGAGAVARALVPGLTGELDLMLDGYAAEGGAGETVAALAAAAGGWVAAVGGQVRLGDGAGPVRSIADAGMAAGGGTAARGRRIAAAAEAPRVVNVAHFDPARDWQAGSQRAVRPGPGTRERRVALPAALTPATARAVAATLLARGEAERVRRTVAPGLGGWALEPGELVAVAGEDGRWRVERIAIERMAAVATLVPVAAATIPPPGGAGGRAVVAADRAAGTTILHAAEVPWLGEGVLAQPRLSVVAAGTGAGWRQAPLLLSLDAGASWEAAGTTAAPASVGAVALPAAEAGEGEDAIEVVLARPDMTLADADAAALDRGGNLALVGDELIQFGRALPLGDARWRLGALRRGRRGTAAPIGGTAAGSRFAMIETGAVRWIDLPLAAIGTKVRLMAAGIGDGDHPVSVTVAVTGVSLAPPAPIGLEARATAAGVTLRWTPAPGSAGATYRITATAPDGDVWDAITDEPPVTIPELWRKGRALAISVRQRGGLVDSLPAAAAIDADG